MTVVSPSGPPPRSDVHRFTTDEERDRRLTALRHAMKQNDWSALIVCGRGDVRYRGRTFYVTDIWQLLADSHVVILPDGDPIFVGGQVYGLQSASYSDWVHDRRMSGHPGTEVANILKENGLGTAKIGIVGMSDASLAAQHLNEIKDGVPEATLEDATQLFEEIRQTNSEESLANYRATSELWRRMYAELEPMIRPRMTEIQLAAEAHRVMRENGIRDTYVLVQTTPYGALSFGTTKQIKRDDIVTLWLEAPGPSGYWLEYRRCYSFGPAPEKYKRFWELQTAAVDAGVKASKAGEHAHKFAAAVQDVLQSEGYSLGFDDPGDPHSLYHLHGIGTDAGQGVWMPGRDRILKETEVATIHPVLKFDSDEDARSFDWFNITDSVLVTSEGGVLMTHDEGYPDGFIEL